MVKKKDKITNEPFGSRETKMKDYVNGPVNVVRLEGKLFGIEKILYILMDVHVPLNHQTKCYDVRAKDVANYLVNNFDNISQEDKIYDFFLEIRPTELENNHNKIQYKNIYIHEIIDMFSKSFYINKEKNTVGISNTFPNIRFHYMDIRDYIYESGNIKSPITYYINDIERSNVLYPDDMIELKKLLTLLLNNLQTVYSIIYPDENDRNERKSTLSTVPKSKEDLEKYTSIERYQKLKDILDKIRERYRHSEVKEIINKLLDTQIKDNFRELFDLIAKFDKKLFNFYEKLNIDQMALRKPPSNVPKIIGPVYGLFGFETSEIISELKTNWNIINEFIIALYARITDTYFIRRFLDKDYITNGIVYTGMAHSVEYIYILIKFFDFKITNYQYLKYPPNKLSNKIKRMENSYDLLEYIYPPKVLQCVDMTNFPKNFS